MNMSIGNFASKVGFQRSDVGIHSTTILPEEFYQQANSQQTNSDPRLNISTKAFIIKLDPSNRLKNIICRSSNLELIPEHANDFLKSPVKDLHKIRNFGEATAKEFKNKLVQYLKREGIKLPNDYPEGSLGESIARELRTSDESY